MGALSGKVAIVTGGGQGIGRAEARLLAAEGAAVIVNDMGGLVDGRDTPDSFANRVVEEIRAAGGQAAANFADVADWDAADAMVQQAIDTFGRIDILLCNAGIVRDRMTHNLTEAEWDAVIRVHLKGHFAPTKAVVSRWRVAAKQSDKPVNGRIIYTTSEAGMFGNVGQPNYSAAKAGIVGLCFEVAKEVGRFGITVNTISPRGRTPMTEGTFGTFKLPEGEFDSWAPENVAPWAAFLARDEAAQISGQIFVVFGGTVQVMTPWPIASQISAEKTWTPDELVAEARKLFPDMVAHPPEFPDVGIPKSEG
jgi:NAD(P)-dependent dehydrogenase (short-subunit alcohol dehydrogenase family)